MSTVTSTVGIELRICVSIPFQDSFSLAEVRYQHDDHYNNRCFFQLERQSSNSISFDADELFWMTL